MKSSLYNKTYNKRLLPISKRFTKICEVNCDGMESESDSNYYSNYVENSKKFDTMSFYEKFKDELNLLIIKNKKENFLNSLERFYHHTGLNRKDKIEKLLK